MIRAYLWKKTGRVTGLAKNTDLQDVVFTPFGQKFKIEKSGKEKSAHPWYWITHGWLNESFTTNGCFHDDMGTFRDSPDNGGFSSIFI